MGMSDLVFDIFAIDRASAVFTRVGDSADATAARVERGSKLMQQSFLVAGAIAVGLGVKSLEMAANFDAATTKIVALGAESPAAMKRVSQGMLDMTGKVGASAQQLADAMYYVEGGGYHGAAALNVLEMAAKGAAVENSNVTDVAKALTGALNDYRGTGLRAAQATNAMGASVASGMMSFQELAEALPHIGSRAAAAHVSFSEMLAALGTMTKDGMPAAQAATYLGQTIGHLAAPTMAQSKAMAALGLNAQDVSRAITSGSGHGLADAIGMLDRAATHAGKAGETSVAALAGMAGGVKNFQGVLMLGGKHADQYAASLGAISDQVDKGGSKIAGFGLTQQTLAFQWKAMKGDASTLAVEIGHDLTPAATDALGMFRDLLGFLSDHQATVEAFGVVVGGVALSFTALKLAQLGLVVVNSVMAGSEAAVALGMSATALAAGDLSGAMAGLSLAMDATPFGLIATAIGGVAAVIVGLNGGFSHSDAAAKVNQQQISDLASTYDQLTGAMTKATRAGIAHELAGVKDTYAYSMQKNANSGQMVPVPQAGSLGVIGLGARAGINSGDLINAAQGNAKAIAIVNQALATYGRTSASAKVEVTELRQALGLESDTVHKSANSARDAWLENQNLTKALKGVKGGTELAHSAYISNIQDLATLAAKHKWTGQEIQTVINAEWQPAMAKAQGITKTNVQGIVQIMNGLGANAHDAMQIAGGDAADGLLNGFSPAIHKMAALAAQAFHDAEAALRKAGNMHSPSVKMYKVGTDLGDGLTLGFRESTGGMADIAAGVVQLTLAQARQETKKELDRELATDSKALSKVTQQIQAAQAWGQAFSGNVFSATLGDAMTTSTTNSTIGGVNVSATGSAPATGANLLQQMFSYQHQQHHQAKVLDKEMRKLRHEGIAKSVLDEMAAAGPAGLAQIAALASATPTQVKQFSNLVSSTSGLYNDAGAVATTGHSMSALQQQQHDDARTVANIRRALKGISVNVSHNGHHMRIT